MLSKADILVENYRPGVMAKLGLSWEDLHQQFPQLIMVWKGSLHLTRGIDAILKAHFSKALLYKLCNISS
jgi:hypothetical protein